MERWSVKIGYRSLWWFRLFGDLGFKVVWVRNLRWEGERKYL